MEFLPTGGKSNTYFCACCQRDITTTLRIRCAECDPAVDLCADCFCVGRTTVTVDCQHKASHSYRIVDCLDTSVCSSEWSAAEELLLFEGIDKFGVGNWKSISDYIVSKTVRQCEENYWEGYMGRYGRCLPVPDATSLSSGSITEAEMDAHLLKNGITPDDSKIAVTETHLRDEVVVRDKTKEVGKKKEKQELPGAELPGFMPLREDFEVEYEDNAEVLLADMEFGLDDHPTERDLKLQIVKIYNSKLAQRDLRKRFVIDRGLVDFKKQQSMEKKRSKDEKEMISRMRMFARFHTNDEHEALVKGLVQARRLRKQIELFQTYRSMGVRTLEGVRQYEVDRQRREKDSNYQKLRESAPHLYPSSTSAGAERGARHRGNLEAPPAVSGRFTNTEVSSNETGLTSMLQADLMRAPGAEHLSDAELELCKTVPLLPLHYLAAKDAIIRELYRNGDLTVEGVKRTIKVDQRKAGLLHDFFVQQAQRSIQCEANKSGLKRNSRSVQSVGEIFHAQEAEPVKRLK